MHFTQEKIPCKIIEQDAGKNNDYFLFFFSVFSCKFQVRVLYFITFFCNSAAHALEVQNKNL